MLGNIFDLPSVEAKGASFGHTGCSRDPYLQWQPSNWQLFGASAMR